VAALSDQDLEQWQSRGAGGFVCMVGHLRGLGGEQGFSADPDADLSASTFVLQRSIRDSRIVGRAAARGMKLYLGFYLSNYYNTKTPLGEWFDDGGWAGTVLPQVQAIAGAARSLGFAGLAFDEELYGQTGGVTTASWQWNYPGNGRDEASVRAATKRRGAQLMTAILAGFPEVEVVDYGTYFPESWAELVQERINGRPDAYGSLVQVDFWDGLTSVEGYHAIRFMNAIFYKTAHLNRATWDAALQFDLSRSFAFLSRRLSDWSYASSHILISPFAWISSGSTSFESAQSPEYVAEQLTAFRRWGMGEFANYVYGSLSSFDYGPYAAGLRAASAPGPVATNAPALEITSATRDADSVVLSGTATDDFAVRSVRWVTSSAAGAAVMSWTITGGDEQHGWQARTEWSARVPIDDRTQTITVAVESTKGIATVTDIAVP
jgi:hypothetical protein